MGGGVRELAATPSLKRLYIMTLGCLAAYRRLGVGRLLLEHVILLAQKDLDIDFIYLHVQVLLCLLAFGLLHFSLSPTYLLCIPLPPHSSNYFYTLLPAGSMVYADTAPSRKLPRLFILKYL